MNWILLIIAGLFEVGFASCLGKAKETSGIISTYWMVGFFVCLSIRILLPWLPPPEYHEQGLLNAKIDPIIGPCKRKNTR